MTESSLEARESEDDGAGTGEQGAGAGDDSEYHYDDGVSSAGSDAEENQLDAEEAVRSIGQTPMLESVQRMLRTQQEKEMKERELALEDLEGELRHAKKGREDLGVQLYGLQQQLAALQVGLEDTHSDFVDTTQGRLAAEEDAKTRRHVLEDFQVEVRQAAEKLKASQHEENAVKEAVRQVEQYLEEARGEIAVARRATHKTETTVADLEKKKQEQDLFIDTRVERIQQLQEEISLVEGQRGSQLGETAAAAKTLREANDEMQAVQGEKAQAVQRWKSTLIALSRRDEAQEAMRQTIQEKREEERTVRAEIEGYKTSAQAVQFESEKLVERKIRQEHALRQVEDALKVHERAYSKLSEQFGLLRKSLEQQDVECRKLKGMLASCNTDLGSMQGAVQAIDRKRHEAEEAASALLNDRTTMSKAAKNLVREAAKVQLLVHAQEMEVASVDNEMSRVRIDKLNTQAHAEQLQEELEKRVTDLNEKDKMIEKYKLEIRQRHDQIEKKMFVKDRLNRKIEAMVSNQEEPENLGPLEATIKNVTKEAQVLATQNRELERRWLRLQTEFVQVVNATELESTSVHELSSTETILQQKKTRLDGRIRSQTAELKELQGRVHGMHHEMHRLNELISVHRDKQEVLVNANEIMHGDFVTELKDLERRSIEAEAKIVTLHLTKKQLLAEIMEFERQAKLWEKKIRLEKEMQDALDPTAGQSVVEAMEKDIHRMQIKYDALIRAQEKMVKQMEKAILRREDLARRRTFSKTGSVGAAGSASAPRRKNRQDPASDEAVAEMTSAQLKRRLTKERAEKQSLSAECHRHDADIAAKLHESDNVAMELEKAANVLAALQDGLAERKASINDALYDKQRNVELLARTTALADMYLDFAKQPDTELQVSQEEADILLEHSADQLETIRTTLKVMEKADPNLAQLSAALMARHW